jgi:hypothetical protein
VDQAAPQHLVKVQMGVQVQTAPRFTVLGVVVVKAVPELMAAGQTAAMEAQVQRQRSSDHQ